MNFVYVYHYSFWTVLLFFLLYNDKHNVCSVHESSVGSSFQDWTNPKPRGNHPTACSGKTMSSQQKAEPLSFVN